MSTSVEDIDDLTQEEQEKPLELRFSTKKFVLQALLEKAATVLPTKDVMQLLKQFQIEVSVKDDIPRLRVVATDLELSLIASTQLVSVEAPGTAVFPGEKLMRIAREAEPADLYVDVAGDVAFVKVGPTQWALRLIDGSDYPELPTIEDVSFHTVSRSKFATALDKVRYAAPREGARQTLMMIDISDGKMRASDGVRFQEVDCSSWWPKDFNISIPTPAIDDLMKLLRTEANDIEIGQDDLHLVFRISGDTFIAQKVTIAFPDMDNALRKPALSNTELLRVDRDELAQAIKRVRINADTETKGVAFDLSKDEGTMVVRTRDTHKNTAVETVSCLWEGPTKSVAFHADHLIDMLKTTDTKTCTFYFGPDKKTRPQPILLRDDDAGSLGVLNQLRVDFLE